MNNKILWGVISSVALFGFLTVVYLATSTSGPAKVYEQTKTIDATDHVTWSPAKKHILTEYGDFQCPACGSFYQYIKGNIENDKTITGNITLVSRNFPLVQVHKHALEAAYAAEAAGKQGKYFQMGDLLYTNQLSWGKEESVTAIFQGYAKQLKLDLNKYNADRVSKEVQDKVSADTASGTQAQVNSTPSFYLDGAKVDVTSLDGFKKLLTDTAKQ